MQADSSLLDIRHVTKRFGGVVALDDVSVAIAPNEVHAIVGENGAGKSTLMKILCGVIADYQGEVRLRGEVVRFGGTRDAEAAGISIIHQELNLVEELSAAANIFLGREPTTRFGFLDERTMHRESARLFEQLGTSLAPGVLVRELRVGDQQLVEIAKALSLHRGQGSGAGGQGESGGEAETHGRVNSQRREPILIMDEPTSALSTAETRRLFGVLAGLKRRGVTILYISHKMDEVFELADRITVLRDGRLVRSMPKSETNPTQVTHLMVGREIAAMQRGRGDAETPQRGDARAAPPFGKGGLGGVAKDTETEPVGERPAASARAAPPRPTLTKGGSAVDAREGAGADRSAVLLEVRSLSLPWFGHARQWRLKDVSFALHRGEILGIAGLMGAGRTELLESLFGASAVLPEGEVLLDGQPVKFRHPAEAVAAGVALVTEDRKRLGLFEQMSVEANISLCRLGALTRGGIVSAQRERAAVLEEIDRLAIRASGPEAPITSLSGGNQQKCILARWLLTGPRVLLLDDPTRGVDVGAKAELYRLMDELCREGLGILMASSELPELLSVCDRVLVLCEGRLTGCFARDEATEEKIMEAATRRATAAATEGRTALASRDGP